PMLRKLKVHPPTPSTVPRSCGVLAPPEIRQLPVSDTPLLGARMRPQSIRSVVVALLVLWAVPASAHKIYMMNDNHTDYGWNATVDTYEASMVDELDYYLDRIDATIANPSAEQARFNGDNWYYLYLYQKNRSPAQFQRLINRILDGHITFPLNPFVELY